jgi:SAM-dependent methyltransferase
MTDFFPASRMPDRDWWSALWPDPEGVLKKLEVPQGRPAVDLCCGDGHFTASLARLVAPARVYALELDPEILQRARERVAGRGETNCVFVQDDARNLAQHIPAPVGFVLIANTFHGVPEKMDLARLVHKVLEARGTLAIVNWHPMSREQTRVLGQPRGPATEMRMSLEQTRVAVEPAGFEPKRPVELPPTTTEQSSRVKGREARRKSSAAQRGRGNDPGPCDL